jgi:hypothetical protein
MKSDLKDSDHVPVILHPSILPSPHPIALSSHPHSPSTQTQSPTHLPSLLLKSQHAPSAACPPTPRNSRAPLACVSARTPAPPWQAGQRLGCSFGRWDGVRAGHSWRRAAQLVLGDCACALSGLSDWACWGWRQGRRAASGQGRGGYSTVCTARSTVRYCMYCTGLDVTRGRMVRQSGVVDRTQMQP